MRADGFMLALKLSCLGGLMMLAENLVGFSTAQWGFSSAVYYTMLLLYLRRIGVLRSEKAGDL